MRLSKSTQVLILILSIITVSSFIFHSPIYLYDLITGLKTPEFSIMWPGIRICIEPIYSFTFYALTLNRDSYKPIIISWCLWISGTVLIYCFISRKTISKTIYNFFYSLTFLVSLFSFVALVPIAGPKLLKPEGYIAVDTHSHTISSHDNVAPAMISLKAHLRQGFDAFFNTEHNHTFGFDKFPEFAKFKIVYPGIQVQTEDKVSIVLLSPKKFNGQDYKNLSLIDTIKRAHENNMFVIVPHWWKWHKYSFEELKNFGIDGFEIYNCGYRNFDRNEQISLINFAKDNNLMMFGVTDWHGWGYMSDVWTVMEGTVSENVETTIAEKQITKVILYRKEQSESVIRFIFEPFYFFYYYISNIDFKYLLSLLVWVTAMFFIFKSNFVGHIKKCFALTISVFYAYGIFYFYIITRSVSNTNTIVMRSVVPVMAVLCILWFILWRCNEDKNL